MRRKPGSADGTLNPVTELVSHRFGTGPLRVLFLHGLGSAGPVWWQIAGALAAAGYASAAPDLRGHGESPRSDEYTLSGYAADVVSCHPGSWDLIVGHSLGGAVAVRSAALDPGFAAAYLLIDPAIDLDSETKRALRGDLVAEAEQPPGVAQLIADHPKWHREDAERKHTAALATSPAVMAATFDDNPVWRLGRELAGIKAPAHVLGAALEPLYARTDFERHTRPDSTLTFEVVPETGHSIYRDDPATVIDRALALLVVRSP